MTTEVLSIRVTETGAREVSRRINSTGVSARGAADGVKALNIALLGIGFGVVVRGILRLADSYVQLQNRLRTVTTTAENLNRVTNELFDISDRSRSSVETTTEIYTRFARGTRSLGLSQERLLKITERLNKATILSGATSKEAENALIQLSQGIGTGTLRGDEFRSVMEQLNFVGDLLADQLGVTRNELRGLAAQGKITSEVIVAALENAEDVDTLFAKTTPTIGQGFAVLRNAAIKFFGELQGQFNAIGGLSKLMILLADNIEIVGRALISLTAITVGVFVRRGLLIVIAKMQTLFALALANPFTALLAVVVALGTFFVQFAQDLGVVNKLTQAAAVFWNELKGALLEIGGVIKQELGDALNALSDLLQQVFDVDLNDALKLTIEFVDNTLKFFKFLLIGAIRIFAALPQIVVEAFNNARTVAAQASKGQDISDGNAEFVKQRIADQERDIRLLNKQIGVAISTGNVELEKQLKRQRDLLKQGVKFTRQAVEGAAKARLLSGAAEEDALSSFGVEELGSQLADDLDKISAGPGIIQKTVDAFNKGARDVQKAKGDLEPGGPRTVPPSDDALKAAQKFRDEFAKLEGSLDPILAATIKYQESLGLLNKALRQGIIDQKRYDELVKELGRSLTTALNPLEQWVQEQERQIDLFKLDGQERSIRIEQRRVELELQKQGIRVTKEISAEIRNEIEARREAQRVFEEREASIRRAQGLLQQTSEQGINPIVDSLEQLQNAGTSIDLVFQKNIVNAFGMAEDALVQFVTTGQLKFREFATAVVADLTRLLARLLLIQSLQFLIGGNPSGASITGGALQSLQGFQRGGSFTVGGTGAPDTELVAFRATKGEKVTIETAAQQVDSRQNAEASAQAADVNLTSVNVLDPNLLLDVIESPQGEKRVLNVIRRNPDLLRALR